MHFNSSAANQVCVADEELAGAGAPEHGTDALTHVCDQLYVSTSLFYL